ncbi:MAG: triose-phosphate isomerase [Candidatus Omnitrophota bacterium]|nr:triose-phosphate isomerase [Candidatus Omnitrophota bacterium]
MRRPIIVGNWKMHKTINEAVSLVNLLKRSLYQTDAVDIGISPPFTALGETGELLAGSDIMLGAQDVYWEEKGAYTGEVSPLMLKDVGCKFVIIGHSERRKYFNETNNTVNKKVKAVLSAGLIPIVCVGERLEEKEDGKTLEVVKDHVENGLVEITKDQILNTIIAYEPVWAIGTGKTATPGQAGEVHKFIRTLLEEKYDLDTALLVRIQYGGSVKPDNIKELMAQEDIDGALVGGASLNAEAFIQIAKGA